MTATKTRLAVQASVPQRDALGGERDAAEGPTARPGSSALTVRGFFDLGADTRGAMFVEYLTLICVVILGGSAAVVSLGEPLVHLYRVAQLVVGLPIP